MADQPNTPDLEHPVSSIQGHPVVEDSRKNVLKGIVEVCSPLPKLNSLVQLSSNNMC